MKFNEALNLKEETVERCFQYFKTIYGRPKDIEQATNRRYVAEKEEKEEGKPYYTENKKAFFQDLFTSIGKIKDTNVRAKFVEYAKAYMNNAPEDGYICDPYGNEDAKKKYQKLEQDRKTVEQQTTRIYNNKVGKYNDEFVG